ncbi:unnamed protein product [Arabis nemorensis]|uniref:Uncharacterized protein n=1 Tax=Arabis nemorensis TaxID=586526 RepID=A0A565AW97_9BRAS|nr:unnamed protein product [Arabis nemorensis]
MLIEGAVQVRRDFPGFSKIERATTSNHCETKTSRIEGFDYSSDVATEESVLESNGENKDKQNQSRSTCSTKARNTSLVMQGRLSLHYSTKEVERDVVDISKRVIVSGLAAKSKCPWRQPKKRGSRQDKRRLEVSD